MTGFEAARKENHPQDVTGRSQEEMKASRDLKIHVFNTLTQYRGTIDGLAKKAFNNKKAFFKLGADWDFMGLPQNTKTADRIADIIRLWIAETYSEIPHKDRPLALAHVSDDAREITFKQNPEYWSRKPSGPSVGEYDI